MSSLDQAPAAISPFDASDTSGRRALAKLALAALAIPCALMAGLLMGRAAGAVDEPPRYAALRAQIVAAHLRQVDGDYVLLAGDSHVELAAPERLCGLRVVNAGLSGATASAYAAFLAGLRIDHAPRAVIVTLGTNDANRKRSGEPDLAARRYAAGLDAVLARAQQIAPLVLVVGPPPVDAIGAGAVSPDALDGIRRAAASRCGAGRCRYGEPYRGAEDFIDGVHLRDYAPAYRRIEARLCAELGLDARAPGNR
jgi:lysophospholipase L1-like esterase